MDGLSLFFTLVLIVFAVLQIILFFKIWGMTNDVKAMRKQVAPVASTFSVTQVLKESYKGNPNLSNIIFDAVFDEMFDVYNGNKAVYDSVNECWTSDDASLEFVSNKYKPLYEKAGIPFPAVFESIKTRDDFKEAFMK